MPEPLQIHIYDTSGREYGPFHWKHVVEWHELSLLDDFTWKAPSARDRPVKELIRALGVPPSIMTRSIFLAPPEDAPDAPPEAMAALHAAGFPEAIGAIPEETLNHIAKRLALSDAALDAEDADFKVGDPFRGKSAAATAKQEPARKPEPGPEPESKREPEVIQKESGESSKTSVSAESPAEAPAVSKTDEPVEASRIANEKNAEGPTSSKPAEQETSSSVVNPLLEGDEVHSTEALEPDDTRSVKKQPSALIPTVAVLLLFVGVGLVIFFTFGEDASSPDAVVPTAPEVRKPVLDEAFVEAPASPEGTAPAGSEPIDAAERVVAEKAPETETPSSEVEERLIEATSATEALASGADASAVPEQPVADDDRPLESEAVAATDEAQTNDVQTEMEEPIDLKREIPLPEAFVFIPPVAEAPAARESPAEEPGAREAPTSEEAQASHTGEAKPAEEQPAAETLPQTRATTSPPPESSDRQDEVSEVSEVNEARDSDAGGDQRSRRDELIEEFPDYIPSF